MFDGKLQLTDEYGYDGDGKRVWAKDYEGYLPDNPRLTVYIGNYYEARVEGYRPPTGGDPVQPCIAPSFCVYFPLVVKSAVENVNYYYADGQRIAMKKDGAVYYLYGDQLGSVSAVADGSGALISRSLYEPWGVARYQTGSNITDYGFTGQMREGDVYFYNARWYDPQLGRFMQADTFVPTSQGTQGFDRYAYINNNPVNGTDPSGHCIDGVSTFVCLAIGGAILGGLVDYARQVVGNISSDGFTLSDFTRVDGASIAASAVAGGIGGLLGAGGAALVGTGFWATVSTSAAGGLVSGRVYRATSNVLKGKDIQENLWDPGEMISNTVIGGFTGALGFGVKRIAQSGFHNGNFPEVSDRRFLLRGGSNSGFAEYNPLTGQVIQRIDLQGPSHAGIPTPHSQQAYWNTAPTGLSYLNGWINVQPFSNFKSFFINKYIQMRK